MQAAGIHHWQQLHYLVSVVGVTLKLAEWDAVIINIFWYMSKHILVHIQSIFWYMATLGNAP